nr:unnamed protein product [Digitaria exilis]
MARSSPPGTQTVAHVCQDFKCTLRELLNKTVAAASSAV